MQAVGALVGLAVARWLFSADTHGDMEAAAAPE
jgi:hypothetical protein